MKKYQLICILLAFLWIVSCINRDPLISGIYVNHGESEYSIADDTLYIEPLKLNEKTYMIQEHVGFQRIRNGKKLSREFQTRKWIATWDPEKQVLTQDALGHEIRIVPGGILLETAKFVRVK